MIYYRRGHILAVETHHYTLCVGDGCRADYIVECHAQGVAFPPAVRRNHIVGPFYVGIAFAEQFGVKR